MLSISGGATNTRTPNGTSSDPTSLVYALNPYESKKGELYSYPGQTFNDLMHQYTSTSTGKDGSFSASIDLTPIEGLQIGAATGCNVLLDETRQFTPSTAYSEMHSGIPDIERGIYSKNKNVTTNISSNIRATYTKRINDLHDITIGTNSDCYYTDIDNVSMTGYGVGIVNSASAINQSLQGNRQPYVGGQREKTCMLGFGALASYTYNDCYDIYGTYKADASSVLPADKRWNTAWAVGLGWTISKYEFMKKLKFITNLNLKASYGYTANLNGCSISSTQASFSYTSTGYEGIRTLELLELYNKDLKPEETENRDLGLNIQLFKKLDINLNYYNRITRQALLDVPISTSTGFSMLKRNIGVLKNEGIECSVNWQALDTEDYRLSIGANIAYNCNKVLDLYYADKIYTSEDALVPDYEVESHTMYFMVQNLRYQSIHRLSNLQIA
jgi:TonB dependent receptor.